MTNSNAFQFDLASDGANPLAAGVLLAAVPPFFSNNAFWLVPALIVFAGLFVYGFRDLMRFSVGRIWAISQVCFRDAIRRRVLWITPLAMLGIVIVSQLQKPIDEQDAIRLTVKLCFFTTGIVVTIIAIITAATNLPREIESRVIYTIVTKPITRLEIVLGKLTGFARVSGAILLIMGVFSFAYLEARSWWLGRQIDITLQSPALDPSTRNWLTHYQQSGLLVSQTTLQSNTLMQYAHAPTSGDDRWAIGGLQDAIYVFDTPPQTYEKASGIGFIVHIPFQPIDPKAPALPGQKGPTITLQLIDPRSGNVMLSAEQFTTTPSLTLTDPSGNTPVVASLSPERANQMLQLRGMAVQVMCTSSQHLYNLRNTSVTLAVGQADGPPIEIKPSAIPMMRGTSGRGGQQLRGPEHGLQPVAVYQFHADPKSKTISSSDGQVPFELSVVVDNSSADTDTGAPTAIEATVYDRTSRKLSPPVVVYPESRRTVFFTMPAEYCASGDFNVLLRNKTASHNINLSEESLSMVASRGSFALNLLKGLAVLWLFTILTAAVALCTSTFLSWPIAVVLTVLIILGHWMVSNLDLGTGLGAQIANEFFQNNSATATVVNQSVERLSQALQLIGSVLPDISSFGVTEQIERGLTISGRQFIDPLVVLALFGLPLVTAAYVFLRNKEVAP